MTSKRFPRAFAAAALCAGVAMSLGAQGAGDAASGAKKNFQCQGCHGIPDWKSAFPEVYRVPKLGGQHPQYIVAALKAYKKGERDHQTMRAIVADMSDQDMEDLAAYYGASASPATTAKK